MKSIMVFITSVLSISTFATCPDFSGDYLKCKTNSRFNDPITASIISISYSDYDTEGVKVPTYTFQNLWSTGLEAFIVTVDGQTRTSTESNPEYGDYSAQTTANCIDNTLKIDTVLDGMMTETVIYSKPKPNIIKISDYLNGVIFSETYCVQFNMN